MNHPIVVEELVTKKILWGLLGTKTEPVFIEIEGYLLVINYKKSLESNKKNFDSVFRAIGN